MLRSSVLRLASLGLMSLPILHSQTLVDLKNQTKTVDFTAASTTKPMKSGSVLPATCSTAEMFFLTTAAPGANVYACVSANTWDLETGGGSNTTSGLGAPTGACMTGAIYNDTLNGNTWICENPSTWQKVLTTTNVGEFVMTGQNGSTPSTPASGSSSLFFSSTAKAGQSLDDTGGLATMVRPTDCSAGVQLVQKINPDGTVTCAAPASPPVAPITYVFPAGSGSSASPQMGAWWQSGSTTAVCPAGTPFQCFLHWNSGMNILAVTTSIPHAWTSGAVSVTLEYQGDGTGNSIQPAVSSGCVNNGSTAYVFNAAQNFTSQTTVANNYYVTTLPALTMIGCSADSMMVLQFSRADSAGFLNLAEASITFNLP